ncbi:Retrovirus-related Pol polyprotein from type-2 retrotransposable element R2DM; Endonuclease [Eumeta japonica]|uniref:Retrovirus-related Pol polyprotein from type-2 retrotransposable element R2DM Endonuclease n=1 Tax=Eumeta variegata TaxID=151549 RepID=A0A4C1YGC9_EUMVA|nr:Retrovirus-related Pol polyprotein from type-2 retrotransposable element R2DM; Endonuclease [Eumeta japonica]
MTRESGNHYDSIVTLQTQDFYSSQNTQKSPQSSDRPSKIASLSTTFRNTLAIYEDWGLGKPAYVLQLDIEKAFDSVDFCALYDILRTRVNTTLANRIMSCFKEHTSITWFGQENQTIIKGKGVKRGCPLSSRLFTIVLDDVLRTLEELVSEDWTRMQKLICPSYYHSQTTLLL